MYSIYSAPRSRINASDEIWLVMLFWEQIFHHISQYLINTVFNGVQVDFLKHGKTKLPFGRKRNEILIHY